MLFIYNGAEHLIVQVVRPHHKLEHLATAADGEAFTCVKKQQAHLQIWCTTTRARSLASCSRSIISLIILLKNMMQIAKHAWL